ncbi:uncharacterized protein PAC_02402 [Phialocephala subalpina]|uniref:Tat pathway signal sequence n=1 Tax=Phialocephala subalpina TaxID=576137 RepID=A0A1L7WID3_9HELO|nr:uncharacterized protein PAC_02402 [Phialocephala subalpina]
MALPFFSKYKALSQNIDSSESSLRTSGHSQNTTAWLGWLMASFFAFTTTYFVYEARYRTQHATGPGSFATGFRTEFENIKNIIKEEPTMFWGGPRWHQNGTSYKIHNPNEPMYVGPPSDRIDEAWDELLVGRYFTVTEGEAESTFGKPHGLHNHKNLGYLIGLDVFHTLHCVDQLRKMLDRDYYFKGKMPYPDRGHRDHCLDHIRQELMCHADLTPIPVIWYEGHGRSFVQSDVVHTCRNWGVVREYVKERYEYRVPWVGSNQTRP